MTVTALEQANEILARLAYGISRGYSPSYYERAMAKALRRFVAESEYEYQWSAQGDDTYATYGSEMHVRKMVASSAFPEYTRVMRRRATQISDWEEVK